jgi:two-component system chemotaxis response regulator CheY
MTIDFDNLNVLVVADSLPLKKLLVSVLKTNGMKNILAAENGQEGFLLFCNHSPSVVLADWDMVSMSAMELTQKIRHDSQSPNRKTPVVLIASGIAARTHITETRDAGVTAFVLKPFSANDLVECITHVINDAREFINCPAYFGPSRRRKTKFVYTGRLAPRVRKPED